MQIGETSAGIAVQNKWDQPSLCRSILKTVPHADSRLPPGCSPRSMPGSRGTLYELLLALR
eukprot:2554603-Prymnesium_polylepis.1